MKIYSYEYWVKTPYNTYFHMPELGTWAFAVNDTTPEQLGLSYNQMFHALMEEEERINKVRDMDEDKIILCESEDSKSNNPHYQYWELA